MSYKRTGNQISKDRYLQHQAVSAYLQSLSETLPTAEPKHLAGAAGVRRANARFAWDRAAALAIDAQRTSAAASGLILMNESDGGLVGGRSSEGRQG